MKLGWKDKLGYDFEFECKTKLELEGFKKYIVYTNPQNPYAWKKKKQKGVDMVMRVGHNRLYIEDRFHSHFYRICKSWFQNSTIQRFVNYPHKKNDYHIVLTNLPENYETQQIQEIANPLGVFIYSIEGLIYFIKGLLSDIKEECCRTYYNMKKLYSNNNSNSNTIYNNNNVYASNSKTHAESLKAFIEKTKRETINNLGNG